ncbi:MAG TPA: hypothetical protein ENN72_00845 [Firmicutes bacterium]|nr:hypothetical protein [Bacillota bacterium]
MKKSDWLIAVLSLAILIGAVTMARANIRLKGQCDSLKKDLKGLVRYTAKVNSWNGSLFIPPENNIGSVNGKPFDLKEIKSDLGVIIIIGKMNCNACVQTFLGALTRAGRKEEIFRVFYPVSNRQDAERLERSFLFQVPYYYGDILPWLEEKKIEVGPTVFVIEKDTGKILASYCGNDVRSISMTSLFVDYLVRLFEE